MMSAAILYEAFLASRRALFIGGRQLGKTASMMAEIAFMYPDQCPGMLEEFQRRMGIDDD